MLLSQYMRKGELSWKHLFLLIWMGSLPDWRNWSPCSARSMITCPSCLPIPSDLRFPFHSGPSPYPVKPLLPSAARLSGCTKTASMPSLPSPALIRPGQRKPSKALPGNWIPSLTCWTPPASRPMKPASCRTNPAPFSRRWKPGACRRKKVSLPS